MARLDAKGAMEIYGRLLNGNGAMVPEYMVNRWMNDTRFRMNTRVRPTPDARRPTPDAEMNSLPLGTKPVCIAFKHITRFAHMNVIRQAEGSTVWCMELYGPYLG